MLYREDDVLDWLHEARSVIRLDGEDDIIEVDEEELAMHKIMSRYDEEDVDNLAYDDDDDIDEDDFDEDFDEDESIGPDDVDWDDDDEEDFDFDDDEDLDFDDDDEDED
jgi:hypothetical protein